MSVQDYPEHLNPFDENYDEPQTNDRRKYNTWGAQRGHQVSAKPTFLEKPWTVLNITPKGKLVRRLSLLKTTVERMSFRRKRTQPQEPLPITRSHSVHNDMNFRIISPKVKAKLREQAIPALTRLDSNTDGDESPNAPEIESRLSLPAQTESKDSTSQVISPVDCPEVGLLVPQPRARKKKRPPPPPPPRTPLVKEITSVVEKPSEDNISNKSSITQDLEKDAPSEDDSLAEFEFDQQKLNHQYD